MYVFFLCTFSEFTRVNCASRGAMHISTVISIGFEYITHTQYTNTGNRKKMLHYWNIAPENFYYFYFRSFICYYFVQKLEEYVCINTANDHTAHTKIVCVWVIFCSAKLCL